MTNASLSDSYISFFINIMKILLIARVGRRWPKKIISTVSNEFKDILIFFSVTVDGGTAGLRLGASEVKLLLEGGPIHTLTGCALALIGDKVVTIISSLADIRDWVRILS